MIFIKPVSIFFYRFIFFLINIMAKSMTLYSVYSNRLYLYGFMYHMICCIPGATQKHKCSKAFIGVAHSVPAATPFVTLSSTSCLLSHPQYPCIINTYGWPSSTPSHFSRWAIFERTVIIGMHHYRCGLSILYLGGAEVAISGNVLFCNYSVIRKYRIFGAN